ncbi:Zn-dependent protease [Chitinimonas prasina]|uniref:Zn-dependent protease n=1 Tax=Chitinimonas prasina TaxID=1434937 RepID=A0ABQ5YCR7_9NEIS|nr:metallopeptidase TldD-related protein [Chitinimonas prasina]GLR12735.1 Zn-dependent protease [Chitinimonas prasina]
MRAHFSRLAEHLRSQLQAGEAFTLWLSAERTDFVRFNHGKVRQAGQVAQSYLDIKLAQGEKHVSQNLSLAGNDDDLPLIDRILIELRAALQDVADDPYMLLNAAPQSSERLDATVLPPSETMVEDILAAAAGVDLVGILAAGPVQYGFANSQGQLNWQETVSWNFDWSLYAHGDKAVKRGSAGKAWSSEQLRTEIAEAREQLALLKRPVKTLAPGSYRAYFTPAALAELLSMLNWGGYSEKQLRAKRSPLLKLADGELSFSSMLTVTEDTLQGLAPAFQAEGFIKPDSVPLISAGKYAGSLVSPRTAKEYGIAGNGAGTWESSESLDVAAGSLPHQDVLKALGTGLYVSNLWYLNFSDRMAGRVTGMTRFATFWVENGEIVAPLNVMRFDDSLYRLLGSELEALTVERELLADPGSYGARSSASARLPGALVRAVNLVL